MIINPPAAKERGTYPLSLVGGGELRVSPRSTGRIISPSWPGSAWGSFRRCWRKLLGFSSDHVAIATLNFQHHAVFSMMRSDNHVRNVLCLLEEWMEEENEWAAEQSPSGERGGERTCLDKICEITHRNFVWCIGMMYHYCTLCVFCNSWKVKIWDCRRPCLWRKAPFLACTCWSSRFSLSPLSSKKETHSSTPKKRRWRVLFYAKFALKLLSCLTIFPHHFMCDVWECNSTRTVFILHSR